MEEEVDTVMEEKLNKSLYRIGLYLVKVIPIITSILYLLNTILSYLNLRIEELSLVCGMSILPWLSLLVFSILLKFCFYHRLFLYYILVNEILSWYDYKIGFSISDANYLRLHLTVAGIFIILICYFKFKK